MSNCYYELSVLVHVGLVFLYTSMIFFLTTYLLLKLDSFTKLMYRTDSIFIIILKLNPHHKFMGIENI